MIQVSPRSIRKRPDVDPFVSLSGGVARYDARALTGYSDGDPVDEFVDTAGGPSGTATGTSRPTYISDFGSTGLPGIRIEPGQYFEMPSALQLDARTAYTRYMVIRRIGDGSMSGTSWMAWLNNTRQYMVGFTTLGRLTFTFGGPFGMTSSTNRVLQDENHILIMKSDGADEPFGMVLNKDVFVASVQSDGNLNSRTDKAALIGGSRNSSEEPNVTFDGIWFDDIVFEGDHNSDTRAYVISQLEAQWSGVL